MDPYTGFLIAKTGLGILGNYGAQNANRDAARQYSAAIKRANALISNPSLAYMQDPGLLESRKMRMANVQSGQLARSGGLRGGNYGRQLMKEGSAYDAAALRDAVGLQMGMAGQLAPQAQAYYGAGGGTPGGIGAFTGPVSQGLSDYAFYSMLRGGNGGTTFMTDAPGAATQAEWDNTVAQEGFSPYLVYGPKPR